ncbi:MAG TPA: hypothetical protein VIP05_32195 [Burkholderiaceae bacterium]
MRPIATLASAFLVLAASPGCATVVAAAPPFELPGDAFANVRGEYVLADGRVAALAGTRRHPRLEIDDGTTHALRALSPTEFASEDGCVRVVFESHANASVTRVRVTRSRACEGQ